MKKNGVIMLFCLAFFMLAACSSNPRVDRIDSDTVTDLSGYWNDTDVRIVAEDLVTKCVNARAITNYTFDYGKVPVVIVGSFRNQSDEHIDTAILTKQFESALINSGKVEFVASSDERGEIRQEREEQQAWASEDTAKRLANEIGADFMLIGSVKTIVDSIGGKYTRTYYVNAELIDVETNRKLWLETNTDIKKYIKRSSTRF
ncbi:MAG TPA: penicillin-binding protein activator LpoB [Treponemataceae bacterium]|nr:penicillin-binding protein activator LpoB [Treponemataceae bacterium]